jgi:hypothetical protein
MNKETQKKLIKDFPKSVVKPAPKGKFGDYVPHHIYTQRLVDVIPGGYDFTFTEIRGKDNAIVGAKCKLFIKETDQTIEEVGDVTKYQLESNTESEVLKLAVSDGIKRCCMRIGMGLELWTGGATEEEHYSEAKPQQTVEVEKKKVVKPTKEEQEKMNSVVNDMVPDDDIKARLQQALEFHEKDEKTRKRIKQLAWNDFVEKDVGPSDLNLWTNDHFDAYLDIFVAYQSESKSETDVVKDVFGDVEEKTIPGGAWEGEPPTDKQLKTFNEKVAKATDDGQTELVKKAKDFLNSGKATKKNIFDWIDTDGDWSLKEPS